MSEPSVRVFQHWQPEGAEMCSLVDGQSDYVRVTSQLASGERVEGWTAPVVRIVREDMGKALVAGDSPWMSSLTLVLRPRAAQAMAPLLARDCELLPVICADAELVLVHVHRVLDALDETASRVRRFRSSGRINWIDEHVLHPDVVRGVDVFRLASIPRGSLYFSQRVVDAWEAAGLTGIVWKEVWSLPLH